MIKALFFDIDGTLVSFATHRVPEPTACALEAAKAAGLRLFIATGRPRRLIDNLGGVERLFDGYITTNGAYCYAGDTPVVLEPMPASDVMAIKGEMDRRGAMFLAVGVSDLLCCNPDPAVVEQLRQMLNVTDMPTTVPMRTLLEQGVVQMTVFVGADDEPRVLSGAPGSVATRWFPTFADVTAAGADKGKALERMAAHFGIGVDETMAFGDGGNDVAMLRRAAIGVAMGNADSAVKAEADYVTASVDDDGIGAALRHFSLI